MPNQALVASGWDGRPTPHPRSFRDRILNRLGGIRGGRRKGSRIKVRDGMPTKERWPLRRQVSGGGDLFGRRSKSARNSANDEVVVIRCNAMRQSPRTLTACGGRTPSKPRPKFSTNMRRPPPRCLQSPPTRKEGREGGQERRRGRKKTIKCPTRKGTCLWHACMRGARLLSPRASLKRVTQDRRKWRNYAGIGWTDFR